MRSPRLPRTLAIASVAIALSAAGSAAAANPGAPTLASSFTARAVYPAPVFHRPGSGKFAKLQYATTWSKASAVYLVTKSYVTPQGKRWVRVLLPGRPNGHQGWVAASDIVLSRTKVWIRVSTAKRLVTVFVGGQVKRRFRAAVGTGGTPTPTGLAAIQDSVPTSGLLGPHILVLTSHSNVLKTFAGGQGEIAIHGWPSTDVLGQAVSHGCVRLSRTAVTIVARYAKPGVPVEVV